MPLGPRQEVDTVGGQVGGKDALWVVGRGPHGWWPVVMVAGSIWLLGHVVRINREPRMLKGGMWALSGGGNEFSRV